MWYRKTLIIAMVAVVVAELIVDFVVDFVAAVVAGQLADFGVELVEELGVKSVVVVVVSAAAGSVAENANVVCLPLGP